MAEYNLSVHAILNIFLERAFYLFFFHKVPFAHQLKLLRKILNNLVIVHA